MTRRGIPPAGPVEAWVHGLEEIDGEVPGLAAALGQVGVHVRPRLVGSTDSANGVVVLAGVTAAAVCEVERLSVATQGRVLVLATGPVAHADVWRLLRAGAADVVGASPDAWTPEQVADRLGRWQRVDELTRCRYVREHLVGTDPAWRAVLRDVAEVAHFTDAPVLVTGESGTGKEGIAQLVHELDPRPDKGRLVVLDCSTVVPSLSGSEFFGHEKGAFTGAATAREGAFELADRGTLFLDEVGELSVPLQAELLRVVQEGTFKRVGSNQWRRSTFRLVCATNHDLADETARGTFREDFFYRIAGCALHLPRLRDRRSDILPLFHHFFAQVRPDLPAPALDLPVRTLLLEQDYPGNIRELRSLVQRIAQRHVGTGPVTVGDVPPAARPVGPVSRSGPSPGSLVSAACRAVDQGATLDDVVSATTAAATRYAIERAQGDATTAARALGVPERFVLDWLETDRLAEALDLTTASGRPGDDGG